MKKIVFLIFLCSTFLFNPPKTFASYPWSITSIDTMKYSRDAARQPFDTVLYTQQIQEIKSLGAQYVAIDTPYDEEFYPFLKTWVDIAHSEGLHVWFRGNFSGWEGWFSYPKTLTREEHIRKTSSFILNHPDLFQDGDSFTACPECEYGGPGNPLVTSDQDGYRHFLLAEKAVVEASFKDIHKQVASNWLSMNPDVAKGILTSEIVNKVGSVIFLDYYTRSPEELEKGLNYFTTTYPGIHIVLGEFGAPIPDLNGDMTEDQQKDFIDSIFEAMYQRQDIIGINYWVSQGGSTTLYNTDNTPRNATEIIQKYFIPIRISGKIVDELDRPIANVKVEVINTQLVYTNRIGVYSISIPQQQTKLEISKPGYRVETVQITQQGGKTIIKSLTLYPTNPSIFYRVALFLKKHL